jgi:hypothetical protein
VDASSMYMHGWMMICRKMSVRIKRKYRVTKGILWCRAGQYNIGNLMTLRLVTTQGGSKLSSLILDQVWQGTQYRALDSGFQT